MKKIYWILSIGGILIVLVVFGRLAVQQKQLWIVETPGVLTPAVFTDENIFFGTWEGFYCVQAETGAIQWQFTSPPVFTQPASVMDVMLFATIGPAIVFGLDRHTGEELWQVETMRDIPGIPRSHPVEVVDNVMYLVTEMLYEGGKIVGLDYATGRIVWTWPEQAIWDIKPLPGGNRLSLLHTLISIHHDIIYFTGQVITPKPSKEMHVFALKRTTGQIMWVSELELKITFSDPFLLDNGMIYTAGFDVATDQPNLYAIDAQTGRTAWRTPVESFSQLDGIHSLHHHTLLFTNHSDTLAFDMNTGKQLWTFRDPQYFAAGKLKQIALWLKYLFANPVSLAEENLLVASGYDLYVISPADGRLLSWRRLETLASARIPPLVAKQSIYVGTDEGLVRYK